MKKKSDESQCVNGTQKYLKSFKFILLYIYNQPLKIKDMLLKRRYLNTVSTAKTRYMTPVLETNEENWKYFEKLSD